MILEDAQALMTEIDNAIVLRERAFRFRPNQWERDFLESVKERIESKEFISERQGDILEEIYRKAQQKY